MERLENETCDAGESSQCVEGIICLSIVLFVYFTIPYFVLVFWLSNLYHYHGFRIGSDNILDTTLLDDDDPMWGCEPPNEGEGTGDES